MQIYQNCYQLKSTKLHLDKISKIFSKILPIYWAFLTYMLLRPGSETQDYWFLFTGIDKVIHLSIFLFLGFCFSCTFPKMKPVLYFQIMLLYALLTEILQDEMGLGRSLESLDLLADMVGVALGYYLFRATKAL